MNDLGVSPVARARLSLVLAAMATFVVSGCGGGSHRSQGAASVPSYVEEPFTPEQRLVESGAHLVVADGCSACHLGVAGKGIAPSFLSLAGHRVRLRDGRRVLITQTLLESGLRDPVAYELSGYDSRPMIEALARLDLSAHPSEVRELAAFIEQIGPEAPPE